MPLCGQRGRRTPAKETKAMKTSSEQVDDRNYWILEHSSRSFRPGSEAEAMWVIHNAYTMPNERLAMEQQARIEAEWVLPEGWVTEHRFGLRHIVGRER
jgi:hypothetical protein